MEFIQNLLITLFFWVFFISSFSYLFFLFPLIYLYGIITGNKEKVFQGLLRNSFKLFFYTMEKLIPNLKITIKEIKRLSEIKSTVIICNHISYLDGILISSFIPNLKAIIKDVYFKIPILGAIIENAGFISSDLVMDNKKLKELSRKFDEGTNLLIFPEGSRSKNGKLKTFLKGAFSLAITHNRPIELLYIQNTDLYMGRDKRILYNTVKKVEFIVQSIGQIDLSNKKISDSKTIKDQVYERYLEFESKFNSIDVI